MTVSLLIPTKLSDDTWLIKNESLRSKISQVYFKTDFQVYRKLWFTTYTAIYLIHFP